MTSTDPEPSAGFDQEPPALVASFASREKVSVLTPISRDNASISPSASKLFANASTLIRACDIFARRSSPSRPAADASVAARLAVDSHSGGGPRTSARNAASSASAASSSASAAVEDACEDGAGGGPRGAEEGIVEEDVLEEDIVEEDVLEEDILEEDVTMGGRVPDVELEDRPASRTGGTIGTRGGAGALRAGWTRDAASGARPRCTTVALALALW